MSHSSITTPGEQARPPASHVQARLRLVQPSTPAVKSGTAKLSPQLEAFLLDRFSTKLEDPKTGRWIGDTSVTD